MCFDCPSVKEKGDVHAHFSTQVGIGSREVGAVLYELGDWTMDAAVGL